MQVMTQQWRDLLFAHWAFDPDVVRTLLPTHLSDLGVELDLFDGKAFIGLVPFRMCNLRLRGLPAIPSTANFAEINVRTYVTVEGRPAVWFFSLDTAQLLPTVVARLAFRLPYCFGRAHVTLSGHDEGSIYVSRVERRWPNRATSSIAARIGPPKETTPLDAFLTDRWGLVTCSQRSSKGAWFGAVEHEPWPLHHATVLDLDDDLVASAGCGHPIGDPILLYSPGVTTTIHSLRRISPT